MLRHPQGKVGGAKRTMSAEKNGIRDAWRGRLAGLRTDVADVKLRHMPELLQYTGGSGVFVGVGDDGQTY